MKTTPPTTLKLRDYETKTSRLILLKVTPEKAQAISSEKYLSLGRSVRERRLWEQILEEDLIICIAFEGNNIKRFAYRVSGKGLKLQRPSLFPEENPFLVFLELVGEGVRSSIRADAFFFNDFLPYTPRPIFQEVWEECDYVAQQTGEKQSRWLCPTDSPYEVYIASSQSDYDFISKISVHHPFGYRKAFLTLLARQNAKLVGAILVELSSESKFVHEANWRVFRKDYSWIQKQAVRIVRIYSSPNVSRKWAVHKALLESAIAVAPALVQEPLSIIEGFSYDYHPVAPKLGFHIEVPHRFEGSFYYWKPINIPAYISVEQSDLNAAKSLAHKVLKKRKEVSYWLAPGTLENISLAYEKVAWAVTWNRTNIVKWRSLAKNHVLFLMSKDKRIRAYGIVERIEKRNVKGLESYPLWIDFKPELVGDLDIDISEYIHQQWYMSSSSGGLIELPNEFGAKIRKAADEQRMEGKMIVEPNPYLLHHTVFEVHPNQIFVVQSWSLRETVFPVIRQILEETGYIVKYAGDRDGQVIFDDIWLMLNESEAILVDFTYKRPNVYLEYGMALVLGKPIIAITQDKEDIPSDTPNLKYILYQDKLGDDSLKRQLPRAIQDTLYDIQQMKTNRSIKL